MSFVRGDLLTKTRKLVKGLAIAKPVWLKAMEQYEFLLHYQTFGWRHLSRFHELMQKLTKITLPEDAYIQKFFKKHPDSKYEDAIRLVSPLSFSVRILCPSIFFGDWREKGGRVGTRAKPKPILCRFHVRLQMEYLAEKKAKKKAYIRLKQLARLQGKKPPRSAIKEIQAEEMKYIRDLHQPEDS
ncbi:hypothetical protein EJ110_NYTH09371 [Nymphaea thermarum]|nr:hypothetical protein EJ110_NYTH09371 [Nymphaea thermarum]